MALEALINHSNDSYLARGMAVIHKRPVPIKILRSQGSRIVSAVLESPSTVDYEGVYRGRSLQFEAKSTKVDTRFDFDNIHPHQLQHMRACDSQGAICFVILEFSRRGHIFYVPAQLLVRAWDAGQSGGRKSIPYDDIAAVCYALKPGRGVALDYLAVVDELIRQTTKVV